MKIGICGDVHWSVYSSILRKRGKQFSVRLENLITSVNWVERIMMEKGCVANIYLGDFFDKPELNAEELSALSHINWTTSTKYFLVGNHEMYSNDLILNSAQLFELCPNSYVISNPSMVTIENTEICFLPYVLSSKCRPLTDYFGEKSSMYRLMLSHNDIKGINLGKFISTQGFESGDIETNADLFINGHLHNDGTVGHKIINIGNLTGQNFSEDAWEHHHKIIIFDTVTHDIEYIENPYAFNFYRVDTVATDGIPFFTTKNNVLSIRVNEDDVDSVKSQLGDKDIIEMRLIVQPKVADEAAIKEVAKKSLSVNHLEEFKKFMMEKLEPTEVFLHELEEVLK